MKLCRHCELVEFHDKMGEQMNPSVVADDNIDTGNFELDAVDDNLDGEWARKTLC